MTFLRYVNLQVSLLANTILHAEKELVRLVVMRRLIFSEK